MRTYKFCTRFSVRFEDEITANSYDDAQDAHEARIEKARLPQNSDEVIELERRSYVVSIRSDQ